MVVAEEEGEAVEDVVEEPAPAPGLNPQGLLAAWVIQVGAFSDVQRASSLEQSLLAGWL